jgi:hypothetical protein
MDKLTRRGFAAGALALGAAGPAWGRCSRPRRTGMATGWGGAPSLPIALQEIYPAALNNNILVAGGFSPSAGTLDVSDKLFIYSPRIPPPLFAPDAVTVSIGCGEGYQWAEGAPLPEPRHHPNLVSFGDHAFAVGGFSVSPGGRWHMLDLMTRYTPAPYWSYDLWRMYRDGRRLTAEDQIDSWSEMTAMPTPYGETVATSLAGNIHVATGRQPRGTRNADWQDHTDSGEHLVYDVTEDRWRRAAPNPHPRNSAAGAVLSGKWHVIGGRRTNGGNLAFHEAYDPSTDTWEERAPLPQGQGGLAAGIHENKILAFGGEYFSNGGGVYANTWEYDPQRDQWAAVDEMLTPRHGLGAVNLTPNTIVSLGGATQAGGVGTSSVVEVYGQQYDRVLVSPLEVIDTSVLTAPQDPE